MWDYTLCLLHLWLFGSKKSTKVYLVWGRSNITLNLFSLAMWGLSERVFVIIFWYLGWACMSLEESYLHLCSYLVHNHIWDYPWVKNTSFCTLQNVDVGWWGKKMQVWLILRNEKGWMMIQSVIIVRVKKVNCSLAIQFAW